MSVNQQIKPLSTNINYKNHLEIGGCDLVDLANFHGTPLYVIDELTLNTACNEYKNAFCKYPHVKFLYACKALCNKAICSIIHKNGFGFDAVSGGELYTLFKSGVDMQSVLFNGNNKSFDELKMALDYNVGRISVDNFVEIDLINELAVKLNKNVNILLRITPAIECHTHEYIKTGYLNSKFGFDLTQIDDAITKIINYPNLKICGLHAHVGSQIFETSVYEDEIEILANEILRIKNVHNLELDEINLGGGLGVKYCNCDNPPSIEAIADVIINKLENLIIKYELKPLNIYIEPGRSIVSTSGVTLYKIGSSKQVPYGTKYFAVDGGMADNIRPAMYQAEYFATLANKPFEKNSLQKVTICGRFCESGDILLKNIELSNPQKDDILCVFNTGAYNYSMSSNYNRTQKPKMVLVNNSQSDIIVNRETLDDLISHDFVPDRIKI